MSLDISKITHYLPSIYLIGENNNMIPLTKVGDLSLPHATGLIQCGSAIEINEINDCYLQPLNKSIIIIGGPVCLVVCISAQGGQSEVLSIKVY